MYYYIVSHQHVSCTCNLNISGRIKSAQLEYSEAHKHLLQALRKAPQHSAVGFKQTVSMTLVHVLLEK